MDRDAGDLNDLANAFLTLSQPLQDVLQYSIACIEGRSGLPWIPRRVRTCWRRREAVSFRKEEELKSC